MMHHSLILVQGKLPQESQKQLLQESVHLCQSSEISKINEEATQHKE